MIDLGQKTHTRKAGKTVWSLRETDRFGIISGVNEKVYFSVHFKKFIVYKLRFSPQFYAVILYPKCPIRAKSVQTHVSDVVLGTNSQICKPEYDFRKI